MVRLVAFLLTFGVAVATAFSGVPTSRGSSGGAHCNYKDLLAPRGVSNGDTNNGDVATPQRRRLSDAIRQLRDNDTTATSTTKAPAVAAANENTSFSLSRSADKYEQLETTTDDQVEDDNDDTNNFQTKQGLFQIKSKEQHA